MFPLGWPVVYARRVPTTIEDRLVVGDASVVADLYRQHGAFIHTISHELVGAAADRLTQQVFAEAWRDRLDFNPSLGTVRNWLIRRTRARVSKPSLEVETAVDRLVVADSLNRMDELRRQVVLAGSDAFDVDVLARQLDQPAATIRANLRRGSDQLKADLAESRPDGDAEGLVAIMAGGPPHLELVRPPEVVWQAIAAELNLDTGAVTADDFDQVDDPPAEEPPTEEPADVPDGSKEADADAAADQPPADDEHREPAALDEPSAEAEQPDELEVAADQVDNDDASIERLQDLADAAEFDRPGWIAPTVVIVALVILIILMLTTL